MSLILFRNHYISVSHHIRQLNISFLFSQISLFDTDSRRTGHEFEGLVTSTMKPLESQCNKNDVFVTTFHQARNYTDQWANLNFIVRMKKIVDDEPKAPEPSTSAVANNNNNTINPSSPVPGPSSSSPQPSTSGTSAVASTSGASSSTPPVAAGGSSSMDTDPVPS